MHGRLKVRTTEEQQLQKHKEQQKKLKTYRIGVRQILSSRTTPNSYDRNSLLHCSQLLCLNPDIYTLWNFRKEAVLHEQKESAKNEDGGEEKFISFCEEELRVTEQCLMLNPKSYGSWHHRYWILNWHPKPDWQKEFNLCLKYLSLDDRNFHCWDFRRLLVNKIGITITKEIDFSTERININFSNYSSWHYRSTLQISDVKNELLLIQNAIFTDPADTSAWFYLRWVLSHSNIKRDDKSELLDVVKQLEELEPDCKWVVLCKSWLLKGVDDSKDQYIDNYKRLIHLDPLRKGHYQHCLTNLL